MARAKQRVDDAAETDFLFDSDFDAGDLIDSFDADGRRMRRPARQRVELRLEEKRLRQQLSDWDDFGQDEHDLPDEEE